MNKSVKLVFKIIVYIFALIGFLTITVNGISLILKKGATASKYDSYTGLLKKSKDYTLDKNHTLPVFEYDTTDLYKVREFFRLDTITEGMDNQWEKVLAIENWLSDNILHDGSHSYTGPKNAIDIWKYSKENNQGVNCRMLAITLHELYLSIGLKARYISCMPKNLTDTDNHVINEIWIDAFEKWVWLDPSFSAYLTDEKGNLLNTQEVRKMMIADEKIVLNESANWNGKKYSGDKYLPYMAKNLYWFKMPSIFGYNVETKGSDIYSKNVHITLYPQSAKYATNNDSYFWQH